MLEKCRRRRPVLFGEDRSSDNKMARSCQNILQALEVPSGAGPHSNVEEGAQCFVDMHDQQLTDRPF